jgi:hypothetical protein
MIQAQSRYFLLNPIVVCAANILLRRIFPIRLCFVCLIVMPIARYGKEIPLTGYPYAFAGRRMLPLSAG